MREPERRFLQERPKILRRSEDSGPPIAVGHASVFDQWTTLWEDEDFLLREIIRPGTFSRAIREGQDVRALRDHNPSLLLGRTVSGTVRLAEDAQGLATEIDLPSTWLGDETLYLMERGDLDSMSFAFLPSSKGMSRRIYRGEDGRQWVDDEITDVDLFDVSIVTYPAYPGAKVSARSLDRIREEVKQSSRAQAPLRDEWAKKLGLSVG
jgi:HK97 family phage prohead protease